MLWLSSKSYLLAFLVLAPPALASSGDRLPEYQTCLSYCLSSSCSTPNALPLTLRLTQWTCLDNCKYSCTHSVTDLLLARAQSEGKDPKVHQFHGKWPFWRLAGMQEPASVLFSLGNLWMHLRGFKALRRRVPRAHPLRSMLLTWSVLSMNAWVWSSVFHTRDTPTTEKLDYFSAALAIMSALHFTVARFFFLSPSSSLRFRVWTTLCALTYLAHISYLTLLPRFDYAYNMAFNVALGVSHNILWLIYALPARLTLFRRFPSPFDPESDSKSPLDGNNNRTRYRARNYRPAFASRAALCVGLTTAAMALELLDFPAIGRVLDAHALWHAATIPIAGMWYTFILRDALDEGWRGWL
ncbi:Per1-like protein [Schizopora paradoxa]|uniref:Post-GPI attachment to proteins factor 3 n=1 Tax=Schizopora paradoxa TaxID=27342 RepID=A0A0H2RTE8_9AGAM|nr:Per1-like protein [Schizopora paradoxa]